MWDRKKSVCVANASFLPGPSRYLFTIGEMVAYIDYLPWLAFQTLGISFMDIKAETIKVYLDAVG